MGEQNDRRKFFGHAGAALAGVAVSLVAAPSAFAGDTQGEGRAVGAFVMSADTVDRCGTCVFWGGERRVARDKTEVHVRSLGVCNNPKSPNYRKTTSPDTGPMKAWVKWPALDA